MTLMIPIKKLENGERRTPSHRPTLANDHIDFILAWDSKSEQAKSDQAKQRRGTFEGNLVKEGLHLDTLPEEKSGLNFIKIHAPDSVLKRYAEILKLRLPMKKFDHISEIKVEDFRVPIFTEVYQGIQTSFSKVLKPFKADERKFSRRKNELTAVFSRDKEYL